MASEAARRSGSAAPSASARVMRWTRRLNRSRQALWVLFWASAAETIIVPIPIELVLIPFMITNRHRLWRTAAVVTAGCLLASVAGYGVGYLFFDTVGQDIVTGLGWSQQMEEFRSLFDRYGFWAIVAVGIVPIPFQVAMLAAGAAGYSLALFVLAATFARGIRYFALALLVYLVGERAEAFWRRHKTTGALLATAIVAAVVAAMVWL